MEIADNSTDLKKELVKVSLENGVQLNLFELEDWSNDDVTKALKMFKPEANKVN